MKDPTQTFANNPLFAGVFLFVVYFGPSVFAHVSGMSGSYPHPAIQQYSYRIIQSYPHSSENFTQGLFYADGNLYESTGLYGNSALTVRSLESVEMFARYDLPPRYFGEGLTRVGDELIQLTYRENTGFVYAKTPLKIIRTFKYKGEGWGLAFDGNYLVMSDGSSHLRFLDPTTYRLQRTLEVRYQGNPIQGLNELEFINGRIYANIWRRPIIVLIDPVSGQVNAEIDLSALAAKHENTSESVLNGIAYIPERNTLLITGKFWTKIYEIELKTEPEAIHRTIH